MEPLNGHLQIVPEAAKPFRREGMGYVYEPVGTGVRFRVDRISRNADGFRGRIEVESTLPGMPPHIYQGRHLLEGSRSLADLKKALEEISGPSGNGGGTVPWGALIRQLTKGVIDAEEAGEPFEAVQRREPAARPPDQLEMLLPAGKVTQWYGPGSVGKGWLAVGAAVCIALGHPLAGLRTQQGNVLYLDWEDDKATFDERVTMVCDGMGVDVPTAHLIYRACRRGGSLGDQIGIIAREASRLAIAHVWVDSFEMAAGMGGEQSNYEDKAIRFHTAAGQLTASGITVGVIDHVNAEGKANKGLAGRSYGSVFKGYLARSTWELKRDQEHGSAVSHVGMYHTKANHSMLYLPVGFQLDFGTAGQVRITREDVRESPELAEPVGGAWRIKGFLEQNGARPIRLIADGLDMKADTVSKALKRGEGQQFVRVVKGSGPDGDQWGVLA